MVVPTRDRPDSVVRLVEELKACQPAPKYLVVVDSSREANVRLETDPSVRYIRSRHGNQPYQRYVGALAAKTPLLVYLDDDLFVEDHGFLRYVEEVFRDSRFSGAGVRIAYDSAVQPTFGPPKGHLAGRLVERFSLGGRLASGEIDAMGNSGGEPAEDTEVRHLWGPMMAFRTVVARRLFDATLFALYEAQLGKGEDKVISLRANRYGQLRWIARCCLRHPAHEGSHYAASPRRFLTKVLVSRLFLAKVYCDVFGRSSLYGWWAFGRYIGRTLGSALVREGDKAAVLGAVADALRIIARTRLDPGRLAPAVDFETDARRDLARAGLEVRT